MSDSVQLEEAGGTEQALPGERLKLARQSKGLTIADVASQLNLSCRYIQALEDSDFGVLPGTAFVKGYIRAYARCLEIPADELVGRFNDLYGSADNQRPVKTVNKVRRQVKLGDPMVISSVIVFFAILLGFMVWWWQTQYGTSHPQNSSEVFDAYPAVSFEGLPAVVLGSQGEVVKPDGVKLVEADDDLIVGEALSQPMNLEHRPNLTEEEINRLQAQLKAPSQEGASVINMTTQKSPQAGADKIYVAPGDSQSAHDRVEGRLQLSFSGDCWITIKDASLKTVVAGTKKAGDTLDLQIRLPARLLIGRASSVSQALFDGEKLDLTELADNDVARFSLK